MFSFSAVQRDTGSTYVMRYCGEKETATDHADHEMQEEGKKDEYIATMCERILMARPGDGDTEELRQTYVKAAKVTGVKH